jgi:hypothetical protein
MADSSLLKRIIQRAPVTTIKLPTGRNFYPRNIVEYDDAGEVSLYAMTSRDEMTLRSQDLSLHGKAIEIVIKSCVPQVKMPGQLAAVDVNFLMLAIKHVSNEQNPIEENFVCKSCGAENSVAVDYGAVLATAVEMPELVPVVISRPGVKMEFDFHPVRYAKAMEMAIKAYEIAMEMQSINGVRQNLTDIKQKIDTEKYMNQRMIEAIQSNTENEILTAADCITQITIISEDAADKPQIVKKKDEIKSILEALTSKEFKILESAADRINNFGADTKIKVRCFKCGEENEIQIYGDTGNFLGGRS